MCLGAGRVIRQSATRINEAIASGEFDHNQELCKAVDSAVASDRAVHVLGLLSPGMVHSHEEQIFSMLRLAAARGAQQLYLHAFLDGRDTPPRSAAASLARAEQCLGAIGGRIASICGRFYAMDRDQRWDRTQQAYDLLTAAVSAQVADSAAEALQAAYARDESDEFVQPVRIGPPAPIIDGDTVIHMNFRADRARQLTSALASGNFQGFGLTRPPVLATLVTLTSYAQDIRARCAFLPEMIANSLGEYLAGLGKTQLRLAETEKYAHVTFFFNGGHEQPFEGEDRILVDSPKVRTYDLKPEMSAPQVTDQLVQAISGGQYDLIVCNYANGDMVGHTGLLPAAIAAAEAIDCSLGRVCEALAAAGGQALITADHGNIECMFNDISGQVHTAHTNAPVPLVYSGPQAISFSNCEAGLADVAPTLLSLMGLPCPVEMQGQSLIHTV